MIVGVCGFGFSGSGAVLDLLKEYDDCGIVGNNLEFDFVYYPGGFSDLYLSLFYSNARFMSSDAAIDRFFRSMLAYSKISGWSKNSRGVIDRCLEKFVKDISSITWSGSWIYDQEQVYKNKFKYFWFRVRRKLSSLTKGKLPFIRKRSMHFCTLRENEYVDMVNETVLRMLECSCDGKKNVLVVNQLFPANSPVFHMRFVAESRAIIVDRDPRDMYLFAKIVAPQSAAWIPTKDVRSFILYYKKMMTAQGVRGDILRIHFEDMIYKYTETVRRIELFLDLKNHSQNNAFFDPLVSSANVKIFEKNRSFSEDISIIETELSEYLYNFPNDDPFYNENDPVDL